MLPRFQRLTRNRIDSLFRKADKTGNQFFSVRYTKNNKTFSRFCIIVSAKTEPKAVKRNLIRRRLFETFHTHQAILKNPTDLIFICKEPLINLEFPKISLLIQELFKKIGSPHFHT